MSDSEIKLSDETIEEIVEKILKKLNISQPIDVNKFIDKSYSNTGIPQGCRNCSNHPSNGGSGICHCVIGIQTIT